MTTRDRLARRESGQQFSRLDYVGFALVPSPEGTQLRPMTFTEHRRMQAICQRWKRERKRERARRQRRERRQLRRIRHAFDEG